MKPAKKKKLQDDVLDEEAEDLKNFDMKAGMSALAEFTSSEAIAELKSGMSRVAPLESEESFDDPDLQA